jgi:hypothetical protein
MKRMLKSISLSTLAFLFLGALTAGTFYFKGSLNGMTAVYAQEIERPSALTRGGRRYCTNGTVNGSYAYQASGFVIQPIPQAQIPAGPFAVNSLLMLSNGSFTFKGTQSFNGNLVPAVGTGTYSINDDCTGTGQDNNGTPYNFVVADDGNEIRILLAVPGTVVSGVAKRL